MGVLDLIPDSIPYPIRGGIIRAVRTGVAIFMGGVAAAIADGSIISGFHFIPPAYTPGVLLILSSTFVGIDKWLRERGLEEDAGTTDLPVSTVSVPDPAVNVKPASVNTDATVVTPAEVTPITDNVPADGVANDTFSNNPTEFDDPVEDKL